MRVSSRAEGALKSVLKIKKIDGGLKEAITLQSEGIFGGDPRSVAGVSKHE